VSGAADWDEFGETLYETENYRLQNGHALVHSFLSLIDQRASDSSELQLSVSMKVVVLDPNKRSRVENERGREAGVKNIFGVLVVDRIAGRFQLVQLLSQRQQIVPGCKHRMRCGLHSVGIVLHLLCAEGLRVSEV
jgi:hypothetical protein